MSPAAAKKCDESEVEVALCRPELFWNRIGVANFDVVYAFDGYEGKVSVVKVHGEQAGRRKQGAIETALSRPEAPVDASARRTRSASASAERNTNIQEPIFNTPLHGKGPLMCSTPGTGSLWRCASPYTAHQRSLATLQISPGILRKHSEAGPFCTP